MLGASFEAAHLIDRLERLSRNAVATDGINPAQWEALRYLGRANRFSRTPAALANYLGSTRGTVSQTLIALESKGLVARHPSLRDKRSIELTLTDQGAEALKRDPLLTLARDIAVATEGEADILAANLRATLHAAIQRNGGRAFGVCHTCRYFRRTVDRSTPALHLCALLNEPLSEDDSQAICVEQEALAE